LLTHVIVFLSINLPAEALFKTGLSYTFDTTGLAEGLFSLSYLSAKFLIFAKTFPDVF
jgi:hypothetical protein